MLCFALDMYATSLVDVALWWAAINIDADFVGALSNGAIVPAAKHPCGWRPTDCLSHTTPRYYNKTVTVSQEVRFSFS